MTPGNHRPPGAPHRAAPVPADGFADTLARDAPLAPAAVKSLVRAADGVPEAALFAVQREAVGALTA
ncbi:hypothetical protein [Streptomyces fagopyri]|uniref:hypothetical protein n=1 Tax=Streptomyces fagopyri TaxID=2662397 RepID=UPI0038213FCA